MMPLRHTAKLLRLIKSTPMRGAVWDSLTATSNATTMRTRPFTRSSGLIRKNAIAWWDLGNSYEDLNRYDEAIDAYRQAIRIDAEYASAWNNLAVAYNRSGNKTAALDTIKELRRLDPTRADELLKLILLR